MSKHHSTKKVEVERSRTKAAKRNAIARRQALRMCPKNGAEVLFGLLWPNK